MSASKGRHSNSKYKDILAEQLAAAEARDALGSSAASLPIGDGSPTPSILDIDSDSDSEDDSSTNSDDVRFEMEDAPDDQPAPAAMAQSFRNVQPHPSNVAVPDKSYFDMRGDKEKRAYIESFCDILGRIKTNHHFRCKGCGETFVGQYLNMLVHMSGTNNHLSVRTRYCKNPIPAIRDKILQDYADYNAKQHLYNSHVKAEPGTVPMYSPLPMAPLAPYQPQPRGRKRPYGELQYPKHEQPQYRSALGNIPAGAAIFENSICNRAGLGQSSDATTHEEVSTYYSKVLSKSSDLQTNCCTTAGAPPLYLQRALSNVHNDVLAKYYGCGFIAPELLHGLRVLDMGCGAGRDCYVLSQLVGEQGRVVGVDMSTEQLATARGTADWHRERFGYQQTNTTFLTAYLERLLSSQTDARKSPRSGEEGQGGAMEGVTEGAAATEAGVESNEAELVEDSFDVIVSNCVINLSPDKAAVLSNAYRLLKPGGELYFSDVYCTQRVPQQLRQDPVLWGECLSGALYWNDFLRLAKDCGFGDPRLVSSSPVSIGNAQLEAAIAQHMPATVGSDGKPQPQFYSATYRLWKIAELEPDCEDYGQAVVYLGTIPYPEVQRALPSPLPLSAVENAYVPLAATATSNSSEAHGDSNGHAHASAALTAAAPVRLMSAYSLDDHHLFPAGKVVPVCGNTYRMLRDTRLRPHFQFIGGEFSQHFGIFQGCGKSMPFKQSGASSGGSCC